jgi:hypothetical protein
MDASFPKKILAPKSYPETSHLGQGLSIGKVTFENRDSRCYDQFNHY